ncbi:efflux RND transporter periplasmic adaptor subunit [Gemmatimonadota bacterium]
MRARVEGQVVRVRREEGQRVSADEVLVVLDARPYQFALDRAAAEAKRMLLTYNSKARLRGEGISENEVEIAEAEYRKAQADSALRQLDLDNSSIRAPISGYVSERRVRVGQWVSRLEHVYTIVDPGELWAVALVPAELVGAMELGDPVQVGVGYGDQRQVVLGILHLRSPVMDAGSGRIRITVRIDNSDRRLTPGMPASLLIPAG